MAVAPCRSDLRLHHLGPGAWPGRGDDGEGAWWLEAAVVERDVHIGAGVSRVPNGVSCATGAEPPVDRVRGSAGGDGEAVLAERRSSGGSPRRFVAIRVSVLDNVRVGAWRPVLAVPVLAPPPGADSHPGPGRHNGSRSILDLHGVIAVRGEEKTEGRVAHSRSDPMVLRVHTEMVELPPRARGPLFDRLQVG